MSACATAGGERPDGPDARLQLTSAVDFQPLSERRLADPYIKTRVEICEAIGATHCHELRGPVDRRDEVRLGSDRDILAFATVDGLGPATDHTLTVTVRESASARTVWSESWRYRTTDDFAPRLELYQWRAVPVPALAAAGPGAYEVAFALDGVELDRTTLLVRAASTDGAS